MSQRPGVETGCGLLFAAPFCIGGLIAAGFAVRDLFTPGLELERRLLLPVFALVFGGVGFGLVAGVLAGSRAERRKQARRRAHPGEPWRWSEDWERGRIRCSAKAGAFALSGFAGLWMAISLPVAILALREELPQGNRAALLALIFPAVGLLLMSWAGLALIRWRKYGSSVFEMSTFPGVVGGRLEGAVQVAARIEAPQGISVRLSNIERTTTGSGKNRRTDESVLWQDEILVPQSASLRSREATTIPVAFRVPFEAQPTEDSSSSRAILWRLELSAETPGADYASRFDVPVFRTPDSRPDERDDGPPTPRTPEAPRDPRIRVHQAVGGRLELDFPAFRHPGLSLGLGLFLALWCGIVVVLLVGDAPRMFPLVFGGFAVLIAWGWLSLTFGGSRAVADSERLSVTRRYFGVPIRTRSVRAAEVKRLRLKIGMQAGGARQTAYHDLIAETATGRKLVVGRALRSRREGEWLVRRLEEALGRGPNRS